jgi:hypothetical protein
MKRTRFYVWFLLAIGLSMVSLWWPPRLALAADKYDYNEDTGSANALVYAAHHFSQTFTASTTYTLTSVKLDMHRAGTDAPDGTVSLRSTDSNGHPSYSDILATASFSSSSITKDTDGNFYEISLSSTTLIEGIKYAIVFECNSGDNATYLGWRYDGAGAYDGGNYEYSDDGGISWAAEAGYDFRFSCWGELGAEVYTELFESYTTSDNVDADVYSDNWVAQSFTTSDTAHSVDRVRLKLQGHGDPGDLTVSIMATDNNGYPTGLALAAGSIDANTLDDGSAAWYYIPMSEPYDLAVLTKYAIVLSAASGDASNKVHWRCNEGGSYSDGTRITSGNAGDTWSDASGDCMFEIYGSDSIRIMSAKVFTSYAESGDWLIGVNYYAQVPPAYPTEVTGNYLSLCLKTQGGTYLAKTQLLQWGNRIGSIYLSSNSISHLGLISKTAYVLSIEPTGWWDVAPQASSYTLGTTDWIGTSSQLLDSWVRDRAQSIEDDTGEDLYTETTPAGGNYTAGKGVLTGDGSKVFLSGIPSLDEEHPQLFYSVTNEVGPTQKNFTHSNVKQPNAMVGGYIYNLVGQWGAMFNMSGSLFCACVMFMCFVGAIGVNVARHGDPKVGVLASIPIALMALYPGFWPWAAAGLIGMACTFLILQVTVLRHG